MSVANITAEGVQQAASIVTGSQSQEKGGQRQVPVSHAALKASQAATRIDSLYRLGRSSSLVKRNWRQNHECNHSTRRVMTSHIMQHFNATNEHILVQSELGVELQGVLRIATSRRAFTQEISAQMLATNLCLVVFTSVGPLPRPSTSETGEKIMQTTYRRIIEEACS